MKTAFFMVVGIAQKRYISNNLPFVGKWF